MRYFDTALILKLYLEEPGSEAVRSLAAQTDVIASSDWVLAEVPAGFHRQLRDEQIDAETMHALLDQWELDISTGMFRLLPLDQDVFRAWLRRVRGLDGGVFLRSGDAMHLTSATLAGLTEIYSNDRHLLAAAPHFGLRGINPLLT